MARRRRISSNHLVLYTIPYAAVDPKSFSMNVATAIAKAKRTKRIPIKAGDIRNLRYLISINLSQI
jgi:hypothetical protein